MKITIENEFIIATVEEKVPSATMESLVDRFRTLAFLLGFHYETVNEALPTDGE